MGAETRLKEKNITLPQPATPVANYVGAVRVGTLLFVSGHGPMRADGKPRTMGKVLGMVNSADGFGDQPRVINGFSDLMVEVFGEAIGKHARSAVGMAELPMGIPVEIEMVLEVE